MWNCVGSLAVVACIRRESVRPRQADGRTIAVAPGVWARWSGFEHPSKCVILEEKACKGVHQGNITLRLLFLVVCMLSYICTCNLMARNCSWKGCCAEMLGARLPRGPYTAEGRAGTGCSAVAVPLHTGSRAAGTHAAQPPSTRARSPAGH